MIKKLINKTIVEKLTKNNLTIVTLNRVPKISYTVYLKIIVTNM